MLQRVQVEGIKFPRLYIAEDWQDVQLAKSKGIPYIKWTQGHDALVKAIIRPTLETLFPGIDWNKVLGPKKKIRSKVVTVSGSVDNGVHELADYDKDEMLDAQLKYSDTIKDEVRTEGFVDGYETEDGYVERIVDVADGVRECPGGTSGSYESVEPDLISVYDYVGDVSASVNLDALQKLGLLPQFVGNIADCVRKNLNGNLMWTEGYTKKLGACLGNWRNAKQLPNLIIIDVSHSIPDGIAATMLTLCDTLRSQCNAELIITSARSGYYAAGAELPSPQALRDYYGRSNEGREFYAILNKYIKGREFGHVFSFGDNDSPSHWANYADLDLTGTKVHALHHFHTGYWASSKTTGYGRWAEDFCDESAVEFDTSWCDVMNRGYYMR